MKKILLFVFLTVSMFSYGQERAALQGISEVTLYGVDFSHVLIRGADESGEAFVEAFDRINNLFLTEPKKYVKPFTQKTKIDVRAVNIIPVGKLNSQMNRQSMFTQDYVESFTDEEVALAVKGLELEKGKGVGVVLLALELNKQQRRAFYELVFFDISTRKVLTRGTIQGAAKGFGLRNYWANSIHSALQKIKLTK